MCSSDLEERRAIARAELAVLAVLGDHANALKRLREERARLNAPVLLDQASGTESDDVNELAGAFLMAGRGESSGRLYQEALQLAPASGEPLNNLAWLRLCTVGPDAETEALVRRALDARPDDPSTLDTAG